MARLDPLGAFALTKPDHGSGKVALETTARRHGDMLGERPPARQPRHSPHSPYRHIHTYEGSETVQTLIVGRDITGTGAFASVSGRNQPTTRQ
jgi:glutaryl-CoA dehydrogenase